MAEYRRHPVAGPDAIEDEEILPASVGSPNQPITEHVETVNETEEWAAPSDGAAGIQSALDRLGSRGGGVLRLQPGTYVQDRTISVPNNTVVQGAGMGATVVKADGQYEWKEKNSSDCRNITLADFTFDGQNQGSPTRMFFGGVPINCHAIRLQILNCGSRSADNSAGGLIFRDSVGCSFISCHVDNTSNVSLSMQKHGEQNKIIGCRVTNPNGNGMFTHPISIESNNLSTVANCSVEGSDISGAKVASPCINANAATDNTVTGNVVRNAKKGINLANAGNVGVTVSGNTITDMDMMAIEVQDTSGGTIAENTIVGNTIRDIGDNGIEVQNGAHADILSNTFHNVGFNNNTGIDIANPSRPCNVIGNVLREVGNRGVYHASVSGSSEMVNISSNRLENVGYRCIEADQPAMVANNLATNTGGLYANSSGGWYTGNHVSNGNGIIVNGDNNAVAFNYAATADNGTGNTVQSNITP